MSSPDSDSSRAPQPASLDSRQTETLGRLFALSKRQPDDQRELTILLAEWSAGQGGLHAGVYEDPSAADPGEAGRGRLLACTAGASLPKALDGDEAPSEDDWRRLELPGIVILHQGQAEAGESLRLIAACARVSQLKQRLQAENFQAMFRGVELEALYEVGLAIASTLDLERLGEEVLMRAVLLLDARRGALYLLDDGAYSLTSRLGGTALERFATDAFDLDALVEGEGRTDAGGLELIPGACHLLASRVEIEGKALGLLVVADKESRTGVGPFQVRDRRTLSLFANQAAIALENAKLHKLALDKERLEREMELAAEIQQQLLPKTMPAIPGFQVLGWNRPARHVGGDYFDFQNLEEGRWGLVVGDVTGKGMPAALLVSTLHSALRVLLDRMEVGPALIERLNQHIFESSSVNKFITLLLASLDTESNRLAYINAGHNPGIMLKKSGEAQELRSEGLPLGLMPECTYGASGLDLEDGDLVCIYSDGITECETPGEEEYGLERLIELLREHGEKPLKDVLAEIDRQMIAWADGCPQGDDQTVVLLRRVDRET
ncbi:MAG: SpoIIE family protein phosphatase [Acidobacteriota bacterium]